MKRYGLRNGINNYLAGYSPSENMQFRQDALTFKVSQTSSSEAKELGLGDNGGRKVGDCEYPAMTKVLVNKETGSKFVLDVAEGSFTDGEIVGLMGENGTGKTTFIQMLAGLHDSKEKPKDEGGEAKYTSEAVSLLGMNITISYKRQDYAPKYRRYEKTVR